MLTREERLKAEAAHEESLMRRLKIEQDNLSREQKDLADAKRGGGVGRIQHCTDIVERRQREVGVLETKLGLRSAAHPRAAVEKDYEVTKCTKCSGSGKLAGGKMCPRCLGQGEYLDGEHEPEQPSRQHKPFNDPPVRPSGTPPRRPKQGPPAEGALASPAEFDALERRIAAEERRRGIDPQSGARTSKMRHPQRNVVEKGSSRLVPAAKALAEREGIPLETAMARIAAELPSLMK